MVVLVRLAFLSPQQDSWIDCDSWSLQKGLAD
jgi:hypothetical protein